MIPKWRLGKYFFVQRLRRVIAEYRIDCILDVGANVGQYRKFLRDQVGYEGLIISFEPDPNNVAALREAQRMDDKWVIQDCALGKETSTLVLNIMESSVFNSFLEPDDSETDQFQGENRVIERVEVQVKRLDQIMQGLKDEYGFKNVFLKLDTQGFDLDVFEGCSGCLDIIRGVQTEISVMSIYQNMPTFGDSLALFKTNGFEVSGLYPISELRFPHAVEFDCIYLPR